MNLLKIENIASNEAVTKCTEKVVEGGKEISTSILQSSEKTISSLGECIINFIDEIPGKGIKTAQNLKEQLEKDKTTASKISDCVIRNYFQKKEINLIIVESKQSKCQKAIAGIISYGLMDLGEKASFFKKNGNQNSTAAQICKFLEKNYDVVNNSGNVTSQLTQQKDYEQVIKSKIFEDGVLEAMHTTLAKYQSQDIEKLDEFSKRFEVIQEKELEIAELRIELTETKSKLTNSEITIEKLRKKSMNTSGISTTQPSYEELLMRLQAKEATEEKLKKENDELRKSQELVLIESNYLKEEAIRKEKLKISGWGNKDRSFAEIPDNELNEEILKKIRLSQVMFDSVNVKTINHSFSTDVPIKTRYIVIKRLKGYGFTIASDFIQSFFSVLIYGSRSDYAKTLNESSIRNFILNSTDSENETSKEIEKSNLRSAYFQCKTIEVWVANDLQPISETRITDEYGAVSLSKSNAAIVRLFFENMISKMSTKIEVE